jgi:xanthine dehydrogenase accessory factor
VNSRYELAPDRSTPDIGASVGGQRAVIDTALALRAAGRAFALAIVVSAEGSTYRKPGALALIADDGRRVGVISGGCLEAGLDLLGRDALVADAPCLNVFDTRSDDDLVFGSGSGCRGRMHVVAVPVRPDRISPVFERLTRAWRAHEDATIELVDLAPGLLSAGRVEIRAPATVLAIGAGPETPPLLRIARTLGWYTSVADHRDGLLDEQRMRDADVVTRGRPAAAIRGLAGQRVDAAIVMTHLADADLEALAALARSPVRYVGLLGPPARRDELLARLGDDERAALRDRLHAPVGLQLGGEGPEAIAIAIAAELQQVFEPAR